MCKLWFLFSSLLSNAVIHSSVFFRCLPSSLLFLLCNYFTIIPYNRCAQKNREPICLMNRKTDSSIHYELVHYEPIRFKNRATSSDQFVYIAIETGLGWTGLKNRYVWTGLRLIWVVYNAACACLFFTVVV